MPATMQLRLVLPSSDTVFPEYISLRPGSFFLDATKKRLLVRCAGETLQDAVSIVEKIKPAGGKWMAGRDWWNGYSKTKDIILED